MTALHRRAIDIAISQQPFVLKPSAVSKPELLHLKIMLDSHSGCKTETPHEMEQPKAEHTPIPS